MLDVACNMTRRIAFEHFFLMLHDSFLCCQYIFGCWERCDGNVSIGRFLSCLLTLRLPAPPSLQPASAPFLIRCLHRLLPPPLRRPSRRHPHPQSRMEPSPARSRRPRPSRCTTRATPHPPPARRAPSAASPRLPRYCLPKTLTPPTFKLRGVLERSELIVRLCGCSSLFSFLSPRSGAPTPAPDCSSASAPRTPTATRPSASPALPRV
jgi:hypothetical protein